MEANVIVGISVGTILIVSAVIVKVMDNRERKRKEFMERMKQYNKPKFTGTSAKPINSRLLRRT